MPRTSKLLYRNRQAVLSHIAQLSRTPYQELLADFMRAAPDVKAIREFAGKYPDRWAQAITLISQLAGFEKGVVIQQNNLLLIGKLSDAELIKQLGDIDLALQAAGARLPGAHAPATVQGVVISSTTSSPHQATTNSPQGQTP